jgi:hypothetical protein
MSGGMDKMDGDKMPAPKNKLRTRIVGVFGSTDQNLCERLVGERLHPQRTNRGTPPKFWISILPSTCTWTTVRERIAEYQEEHGDEDTEHQNYTPGVIVFCHPSALESKLNRDVYERSSEVWVVENGRIKKVKDRYGIDGTNVCCMCGHAHPEYQTCERAFQPHNAAKVPASSAPSMRRFVLERTDDVSGVSGIGTIMEGVVFSNGQVAYSWISPLHTVTTCQSLDVVEKLHGHDGRAKIRFVDEVK